jgi:hypothetical protein
MFLGSALQRQNEYLARKRGTSMSDAPDLTFSIVAGTFAENWPYASSAELRLFSHPRALVDESSELEG